MKKIMEIPGGRGSNAKLSGTENPVGWGVKLEKTLRGGGMDIFWNHTFHIIVGLTNIHFNCLLVYILKVMSNPLQSKQHNICFLTIM